MSIDISSSSSGKGGGSSSRWELGQDPRFRHFSDVVLSEQERVSRLTPSGPVNLYIAGADNHPSLKTTKHSCRHGTHESCKARSHSTFSTLTAAALWPQKGTYWGPSRAFTRSGVESAQHWQA